MRPRRDAADGDAVVPTLRKRLLEGLERCARDYERQSDRPIDRRRHVGALLIGMAPGEERLAADLVGERLRLRIIDIDLDALDPLPDEWVAKVLAPLSEAAARIVVLHGLRCGTDRRVLEAIEWSDVDVLLMATAKTDVRLDSGARRRLLHRIPRPSGVAGAWSFVGLTSGS